MVLFLVYHVDSSASFKVTGSLTVSAAMCSSLLACDDWEELRP